MHGLLRTVLRRAWETLYGGLALWRMRPLIPLLAAVPELIQHVLEYHLGMFASRDAFRALANHPLRWDIGYFKVAAYFLAIMLAARFWREPGATRAFGVVWHRLAAAAVLIAGCALSVWPLQGRVAQTVIDWVGIGSLIVILPLFVAFCGALLGDRAMTFGRAIRSGWLRLPLLIGLPALAVLGGQALHRLNHILAFGQANPLVLALLAWDAIWVGCMAGWIGTGLAKGYAPLLAKR